MRYEGMNVYPAYPLPIIMPISNNEYKGVGNMDIKSTLTNKFKNVLLENKLNEKIKEFAKYEKQMSALRNKDKVRRYFNYEIIDKIRDITGSKDVSTAYVKMYEMLVSFDIFEDASDNQLNIFHICEHPGAFVFATYDFIRKND